MKVTTVILRLLAFLKSLFGFRKSSRVDLSNENQLPDLVIKCQKKKLAAKDFQSSVTYQELSRIASELQKLLQKLRASAPSYDLPNSDTPANGYRSFVKIVDQASYRALDVLSSNTKGDVLLELTWLFQSLLFFARFLVNLMDRSEKASLYPPYEADDKAYTHEILQLIRAVKSQSFYGRFIANHFEPKLRFALKRLSQIMVCFGQYYYGRLGLGMLGRIFNCLKNDQYRAVQHVTLVEHAGIDFIKAFWALSESPYMMIPMRLTNPIKFSRQVTISKDSVLINGVEVRPSSAGYSRVTGQLISKTNRQGMHQSGPIAQLSRGLVLHVHGGGFVSQSAQSQEIFLRKWATHLDVPVFSIDYSLAPDAKFPEAVHQVFYCYCVAVTYAKEYLGSTAERVVFAGDSAGGNIILGAMQLCIDRGIRLPDGLLLAYVPLFVSMVPSPSRLLSLMDPLLPYGLMMRCAKAYITGDGSGDNFESLLDVTFPLNPLVSPYICPDQVLKKLPRISLLTSTLDPCLDDAIMFTKKLQKLGNQIQLDVADGLPHGFLNLCWVNEEMSKATRLSGERILSMLNL